MEKSKEKVSLVIATLNRKFEVEILLKSLVSQTYKNFEVIIVDQNINFLIDELVLQYKSKLDIKHYKITKRNVSFARNYGLKKSTGTVLAIPDDDCVYDKYYLEKIIEFFEKNPDKKFISTKVKDTREAGKKNKDEYSLKYKYVNNYNFLKTTCAITIFFKKEVINRIGYLDEKLGQGEGVIAMSEDHDFVLKGLKKYKIYYLENYDVYHPFKLDSEIDIDYEKKLAYNQAKSYVCILNRNRLSPTVKMFRLINRIVGYCYRVILNDEIRKIIIKSYIKGLKENWNFK